MDMFKIIKGHVEIYVGYGTPHESIIGILSEHSCFGEFGLLLKKPAIYTAIAYDDVLLLRIAEDDLEGFINDNHKNIIDIMRTLAENMMTMRFQIDLLLNEIENGKKFESNDEELKDKIRQARHTMLQYALTGTFRGVDSK